MRSGTSYFDWTVFKKTLLRYWPLWGAYFAIWLVVLPLNGLMMLRLDSYGVNDFDYMREFAYAHVPQTVGLGWWVLPLVFGALAAMAVFSHLYNARSANFFGGLPIRREGLFLTHYLAGLAFLVVPNAVICLLTLLVELAGGCVCLPALGFWLAVTCGEGFFFYSLAVFCGLFTGHLLALPLFYAIVNVLAIGITELMSVVLRGFYYGFTGLTEGTYAVVKWLTPAALLDEVVGSGYYQGGGPPELEARGLGVVGVYAVVALALAVGAFFLYRARRLESAGDVVSVKAMRPVFQYGVAFCAGLFFGMATTMFTGGGQIMLMIAILVWAVIGYFAARMLLDKTFRVFHRWKGALAVAAAFVLLFCVVAFDLTGFETRVPDPDQVDSVYVRGIDAVTLRDNGDYIEWELDDPEVIRLITILHRAAVDQRDGKFWDRTDAGRGWASMSLRLNYRLKGGGTLSRQYSLMLNQAEVDQEGTAAWAVQQLFDNRELYWKIYYFERLEAVLAGGVPLDRAKLSTYDEEAGSTVTGTLYGGDARTLLAAVKEDFFAGRISARWVREEEYSQRGGVLGDITFCSGETPEGGICSVTIALQDTSTSTLAALDELADRVEGDGWTDPAVPDTSME